MDAHNGSVEAQNGALEGLLTRPVIADSRHFDEEHDLDPHLSKKDGSGSALK
jgi:hypothetical protein